MHQNIVTKTVLAAALVLGCSFTAGCANTARVNYVRTSGEAIAPRTGGEVEVLLDRAPEEAFVVTGHFTAHTGSSERSIAQIKAQAAAAGLDGVYWIDCDTTFDGECSAKGFVYKTRATNSASAVISAR